MKRLKSFLLVLLLFCFPCFVNAQTKFILPVISTKENEVSVPLTIEDYEEFQVIGIKIHYDNTKLTFQEGNLISLQNGFYHGLEEHDGVVTIYAFNLTEEPLEVIDHTLANLTFEWLDSNTAQLPLEIEVTDFSNADLSALEYEVVNGLITKEKEISLKEEAQTDKNLSWSSSDERVASVDPSGQVTFHEYGEVTIKAQDENGNVVFQKTMVNQQESPHKMIWWIIPISLLSIGTILGGILYVQKKKNKKIS